MITRSQNAQAGASLLSVLSAVVLVWTASVSPVLAATPPAGAGEAASAPDDKLVGTVHDSAGLPLIGALVAVLLPSGSTAVTISDSHGRFVVENLPPGVYTVMAKSLGFVSAMLPGVVVPREEPVSLQLRAEPTLSLMQAGTPLDLGWALRPGRRDVLRQTEATAVPVDLPDVDRGPGNRIGWITGSGSGTGLLDAVDGELSLWTLAPFFGPDDGSGNATDVLLGSRDGGPQKWVFRAQVVDADFIRVRTRIRQRINEDHALDVDVGFAGRELALSGLDEAAERMWVGSVSATDTWWLAEPLSVSYGLRFEHYNYLDNPGVVSPRIEVAYAPIKALVLRTGVSYDAEAPGLAELSFEIDPLAVRYMDVLTLDGVEPERTLRYELGVEHESPTAGVSARAFVDQSEQELVGFYAAHAGGRSDYRVFSIGDTVTRGFELDLRRTFFDNLASEVSYTYGQREHTALPAEMVSISGLIGMAEVSDRETEIDTTHEFEAAVETVVGSYDTRVRASWLYKRGVPVIRGGDVDQVYERVDVRVRQPLPFRVLASDWAALVQVQNVLGREYDGIFNLGLDDVPILSRLVAGGLAVRF